MRDLGITDAEMLTRIIDGFRGLSKKEKELSELERLIGLIQSEPDNLDALRKLQDFCRKNGVPLPRQHEVGGVRRLIRVLFSI
jgi:hypothetical protein